LLLDISSIVIFHAESKGGRSEAHLRLGSSRTQFLTDAAVANWMASEEKQVLLGHHSFHHKAGISNR